jgi:hypothetical protein
MVELVTHESVIFHEPTMLPPQGETFPQLPPPPPLVLVLLLPQPKRHAAIMIHAPIPATKDCPIMRTSIARSALHR